MSGDLRPREPDFVSPIVVKVGGSLISRIPELVPVLQQSQRPLFIVPGGGLFADSVRSLGVSDNTAAHWMAVAAMDQYGWFLASHGLGTTDALMVPERSIVFLPYTYLRQKDPLPHSWDITSDTIAAWAAGLLRLDLLVLKSIRGIVVSGELQESVNSQVDCDAVDPFFINYVLEKRIRTSIIDGSVKGRLEKYLMGEKVPGTAIGTTF
jgi:5-(aminomethyl)-3-furanmethanol phosphate kinase